MSTPKQERWTSAEVQRLLKLRFREDPECRLFAEARCHRDKQLAWGRVSQRLHAELPLRSGDERSPTQCEQKLKNLRKEYIRLQGNQLQRSGDTRLPVYWQLLKDTVGKLVDNGTLSSPSSSTDSKSQERTPPKAEPTGSLGQTPRQTTKRRRDNSMLSPSDYTAAQTHGTSALVCYNDRERVTTTAVGPPIAKRARAPGAASTQILQSVEKLNTLVAQFVASDSDAAASSDMERRLAKVESDVASLGASVRGMSAKMDQILAVISEWDNQTECQS